MRMSDIDYLVVIETATKPTKNAISLEKVIAKDR